MKIKIAHPQFQYLSDNSSECSSVCAFFCTAQNESYMGDAQSRGAVIVTPKVLEAFWQIRDMKIVGITGTNGKTTTAAATYSMMLDLGFSTALQGTRGFFINDERIEEKGMTTPPLLETLYHLHLAKEQGCSHFIMEVSSHAIDQKRIESLQFALKVYTNLTQDHLDYHGNFESYRRVKSSFFMDESMKLINKDAKKIEYNMKNCYTYALDAPASFNITAFRLDYGIHAVLKHMHEQIDFYSPLQGLFNLYNILAAISAVKLLTQMPLEKIAQVVENFAGVSGRMEVVSEEPLIIVDFAHTPDGMLQVMDSLKSNQIVVLFGAGGDRDRSKRPQMGRVANRFAKRIYVTSDNPRSEDPQAIIDEICAGIEDKSKVSIEIDRAKAIEQAMKELQHDEILMILGKGDEATQEIAGEKRAFDDRLIVKKFLQEKSNP